MKDELTLVDGFFEAALAPELWAETLGKLSDYIGGAAVNLILIEKPAASPVDMHFERVDEQAYARYINDYIAVDPRVPRILQAPVNRLLLEHHVLTEEEKRTGAIYNELLARSGMRNQAITLLSADSVFAGFGVAPRDDSRAFEPEQLARLARVLPHLRHAVRFYVANTELQLQRSTLGALWSQSARRSFPIKPPTTICSPDYCADTRASCPSPNRAPKRPGRKRLQGFFPGRAPVPRSSLRSIR
jgi:hypothetical protein